MLVEATNTIPNWMVWEYQNDQWRDGFMHSCCVGRERYSYSDCPKYYNYTQ